MIATKTYTAKEGSKLLLKSYLLVWAFYFSFFMVLGILSKWFPELINNEYKQERLLEMLNNQPIQLLISAVIIAPIFEEIMFRSLIKPSYEDLLLFISGWLSFLFMGFSEGLADWYIRLLIMFGVFIGIYYVLQLLIPKNALLGIQKFLGKYVLVVLIITSLIFGMAHIYNYVESFLLNAALFAMIIPRIVLGGIAGWLKLKTGVLIWPILLHFLNNAFVIGVMLVVTYTLSN
ncbi:CPBP family intramembrane glutamic endopeptidase [Marixanthomonas ophiurae]|uniref:CPBP family intramembrane metalloprotease n=1 Tax=Marixanthomonas ophiurae TaxID=387659 RepID=A0A3E1Q714_9FLAO|nr:CPBP family intramembrane glutamic endopeptidase [Marixanthomonas ophiurae]RFN57922.1 CPBP family intramembrane metalloprotease [Marixanthomonas ophiurae]